MSSQPLSGQMSSNTVSTDPNEMTLFQRLKQSSHPVALLCFLAFRFGPLLTYMFGLIFTSNFILIFVIVILLLAADFWNVKNVSGRLLVGLRWWNESSNTGESIWVFESADPQRYINPIDSKMFWLMLYITPALWVVLAILAILQLHFVWLLLVLAAMILTVTNAAAFSRCDKFSKANAVTSNIMGNVAGHVSGAMLGRVMGLFGRG